MAGAYGSVARPVVHDPFHRIVEVHWRTDVHIAILWQPRARSRFVEDSIPCDPIEYGGPFTGYPPPPSPVGIDYLSGVEYYFPNPQGIADILVGKKSGGWDDPRGGVVVTGLPTLPAPISHASWQYLWTPTAGTVYTTDTAGDAGSAEDDLAASFSPASGTDTDIRLPRTEGFFQTGFTPAFGFRAKAYLSADPVCYFDGAAGTARLYDDTPTWVDTIPVPLADIVATYRDKTYRGFAAGQVHSVITGVPLDRACWILCQREETTS